MKNWYKLLQGNSLDMLRTLDDKSVNTVVTSPPFYGLRNYGTGRWEGGDDECDHNPQKPDGGQRENRTLPLGRGGIYRDVCGKCGAVRIDEQIGLEQTPQQYVDRLVEVFREVRRVLRDDGTIWVNLGDSYNGSGGAGGDYADGGIKEGQTKYPGRNVSGLKPKDLIGIPWMVAFALRADGWYLRSDIIWSKGNPMPESVQDRPTKAHEYIFLLSKSSRYYYDLEAIREENAGKIPYGDKRNFKMNDNAGQGRHGKTSMFAGGSREEYIEKYYMNGRNKRSVWHVNTQPSRDKHYAAYPPKLIRPCVLAGCPEGGVVLDPFNGKGTTGMVAGALGRNYIGIDLNPEYIEMSERNLRRVYNKEMEVIFDDNDYESLPMFAMMEEQ